MLQNLPLKVLFIGKKNPFCRGQVWRLTMISTLPEDTRKSQNIGVQTGNTNVPVSHQILSPYVNCVAKYRYFISVEKTENTLLYIFQNLCEKLILSEQNVVLYGARLQLQHITMDKRNSKNNRVQTRNKGVCSYIKFCDPYFVIMYILI